MKIKYDLTFTNLFLRRFAKLSKKNLDLKNQVERVLHTLKYNPFAPELKTHKANNPLYNLLYTSRVNGDLRIAWKFEKDCARVLNILQLGGHSGKNKVYK